MHKNLECFAMSGLVLKGADRSKTTFASKFGGRCIVWFLMSASVGAAVDQIDVRKEAFTRPHSPVCVTFKPRLSFLKKLGLTPSDLCLLLGMQESWYGVQCNLLARPFMG